MNTTNEKIKPQGINFEGLVKVLTNDFKIDVANNRIDLKNYFNLSDKAMMQLKIMIAKDVKLNLKTIRNKDKSKFNLLSIYSIFKFK